MYPRARTSRTSLHAKKEEPSANLFGNLEVRPSISTTDGTFTSENCGELGIAFSPTKKLSYVQEVESEDQKGTQHPYLADGWFRLRLNELWKDKESGVTFSDQVRVYLPTLAAKKDAGMIFSLRNYFIFSYSSAPFSFTFMEVPVVHFYSDGGSLDSKGKDVANPLFENRVILGPKFQISKSLSLEVLTHFYLRKYQDYAVGAKNNDLFLPDLWMNPELTYSATDNFYLGVGYRTNNFLSRVTETEDTSYSLADDFGHGVFQFIAGISF